MSSNGGQTSAQRPVNEADSPEPNGHKPDPDDAEEPELAPHPARPGEPDEPPPSTPGLMHRLANSLNHSDLARDLVIGVILIAAGFALVHWLDNSIAARQELLENTRFVREVAINPEARSQPFAGLNLAGAQLGGLDLSCRAPRSNCAALTDADLSGADMTRANLGWCGPDRREPVRRGPVLR